MGGVCTSSGSVKVSTPNDTSIAVWLTKLETIYTRDYLHNMVCEAIKDGSGLEIKDRTHNLKSYKNCFIGKEFVQWMVTKSYATTESEATEIG